MLVDIHSIQILTGLDERIVPWLIEYGYVAIFLGSFFFAESFILAVSFLSAHGFWPIASVFGLALGGSVLSDLFWYFFGIRFLKLTGQWMVYEPFIAKADTFFGRFLQRRFLSLLVVKFLYGTRFLMVVYFSVQKISFLKFLLFDAVTTAIWLAVLLPVGWFAGLGSQTPIWAYRDFILSVSVFAVMLILLRILGMWLQKRFLK